MSKIETPEEFGRNHGYASWHKKELTSLIAARDAQYLALLKTCGEALKRNLADYALINARNDLLPPFEQVHPFTLGPQETESALAALEDAGVKL